MRHDRLDGRRVLIVDDDEDILGSIDLAMRSEGASTVTATDGAAAVALGHAEDLDAVVLDMMLPRQSGFLVLEKLMELEDPPPVVMVTANQGRRHMEYARALGVSAYLNKPVALQRLVDTVVDLIERAEAAAGAAAGADEDDTNDPKGANDANDANDAHDGDAAGHEDRR